METLPEKALRFAVDRHAGQFVPGTQLPYVVHVATVAAEVNAALAPGDDAELAICCALLHDTIEDTSATYADVVAAFGARIADGVQALSKDPAIDKDLAMADSLRRIRLQPREVWMVKLADRIANLARPPAKWSTDKRRAYRDQASEIADALGSASAALDARIRTRIDAYAAYF